MPLRMPENVRLFEYYSYGALTLSIVVAVAVGIVSYAQLPYEVTADPAFRGIFAATLLITLALALPIVGIFILLVWLTARRRSVVARFILALLYAMGLLFMIAGFVLTGAENLAQSIPGIVAAIGQGIALFLIFTGDARPWFTAR